MFICSLTKLGNVQGVKVAGAALAQATFFFGQPAIFNQLADQSNNGTAPGAELRAIVATLGMRSPHRWHSQPGEA